MYTFQLPNLPANTLPKGMKFARDCQHNDLVKTIGNIVYRDRNNVLIYSLKELSRPIIGRLWFYGKQPFVSDYRIDDDTVVEILEG